MEQKKLKNLEKKFIGKTFKYARFNWRTGEVVQQVIGTISIVEPDWHDEFGVHLWTEGGGCLHLYCDEMIDELVKNKIYAEPIYKEFDNTSIYMIM